MDAIQEAQATDTEANEAVEPDPAQVITLVEEDSSDEDYGDW